MIADLARDMEDTLQYKDKNHTKRKIQELKDRLISDWQHANLIQDSEEKRGDDVENPPQDEISKPSCQQPEEEEEDPWDPLPSPLEFPSEFLYDPNAGASGDSTEEFEREMGFPFQGSRYDPECSSPKG